MTNGDVWYSGIGFNQHIVVTGHQVRLILARMTVCSF